MASNGAQLHLILNHFPVIGFLIMIPALVYAILAKKREITRFLLVSTTLFGVSAIFALQSGESAEKTIEDLPGIQSKLIHEHEEAAELAAILGAMTGFCAAVSLLIQYRWPQTLFRLASAILVLCIISAIALGNAAHAGGLIRHPEIRANS